jgi:hypothetical protein
VKTAATDFVAPSSHRVLDLATSKGNVMMRYTLMIADGLTELICSARDNVHKNIAAKRVSVAAARVARDLRTGVVACNTKSVACMHAYTMRNSLEALER